MLVVFASINAFVTYLLFHDANLAGLCKASALWFIFASFIMVGVAVLAVATSSAVGAGAFGIGLMIVMGVLGLWESVAKFSPAGVHNLAVVMATKQSPESWLSLPITIVLIVVLTAVAVGIFSKRDL